ncbi:uncharacterized protein LOC143922576 isoform X2 [Arctopsyche grandis]|uniref:uncharacterized protein LOC143922576 isoform X2 n=1 Tax=Arctopsyche grandis TaxID=121162 RepID=UPI00406D6C1E
MSEKPRPFNRAVGRPPYSANPAKASSSKQDDEKKNKVIKRRKSCEYCVTTGKPKRIYLSHMTETKRGNVMCRFLRAYKCSICNATDLEAHMESHCPLINKAKHQPFVKPPRHRASKTSISEADGRQISSQSMTENIEASLRDLAISPVTASGSIPITEELMGKPLLPKIDGRQISSQSMTENIEASLRDLVISPVIASGSTPITDELMGIPSDKCPLCGAPYDDAHDVVDCPLNEISPVIASGSTPITDELMGIPSDKCPLCGAPYDNAHDVVDCPLNES